MSRLGTKRRMALLATAMVAPLTLHAETAAQAVAPVKRVLVIIPAQPAPVTPPGLWREIPKVASTLRMRPESTSIDPFSGNLNPFSGNLNPFNGNLNPFNGNLNPFNGNLNPFNGNLNPFWGNLNPFNGNLNPFWGNLNPFSGNLNPFWGNLNPFTSTTGTALTPSAPEWATVGPFWTDYGTSWSSISNSWYQLNPQTAATADYANVATQLSQVVAKGQAFWGAAVQAQTGKSFAVGFANPLLAKYGIDLANPDSLRALAPATQQQFFLEWYDGLMNFSGRDHVDHWMGEINWNPSLTMQQGAGLQVASSRTVIGLLDFTVGADADILNNVIKSGGVSRFTTGHGAAVASLIVSAEDGKGVMGIAPMSQVIAYNPFDATGTAGFPDVTNGLVYLYQNKATVVNASLGVSGYTLNQGWSDVFSSDKLKDAIKKTVYVVAAGNDGVAQTQNVAWNYAADPNLIVVGSVGPNGQISSFSNTPGTACLTDGGACNPGNELKNRFIVAPGELILVSDDTGGVKRVSGTSFAAPLVSGAIALLHYRWPWLSTKPAETVQIILQSAKHLGDPGVNGTYGVGELDVTASQSPLSFDNLSWASASKYDDRVKNYVSAATVRQPTMLATWEATGQAFYAFENIGTTYRDFAIPLSSKLTGLLTKSADGSNQMYQSFLASRLTDWIKAGASSGKPGVILDPGQQTGGPTGGDFTSFTNAEVPTRIGNYQVTMSIALRTPTPGFRQSTGMPYQSALHIAAPDGRLGAHLGFGDGAGTVSGQQGFGLVSDYDANFGGANPLLGMASGGGYGSVDISLTSRLRVSAGVTQRHLTRDLQALAQVDRSALGRVATYSAGAQHVGASYRVNDIVAVRAAYTRLHESSALLGIQSLDPSDFAGGTTTRGVSVGADLNPGAGFTISGTATSAQTSSASAANFQSQGIASTSFEGVISKNHVFDGQDRMRVSFSQPLHLDRGSIGYSGVEVIDRETGQLGVVEHSFELTRPGRRYVGEMLYAHPIQRGTGEFDLFGRVQSSGTATDANISSVMAGARVHVVF